MVPNSANQVLWFTFVLTNFIDLNFNRSTLLCEMFTQCRYSGWMPFRLSFIKVTNVNLIGNGNIVMGINADPI